MEEINASGGVLGKQIEASVVDPASDWDLFAEKAKDLISKEQVVAVFGCWTSVSRKSVLPVFEEYNSLLFYPVQYEGEEQSLNVFYTGATPNQQLIPAAEYLMSEEGGAYKKFYLLGTDYVFPRTANKVLKAYLKTEGVPDANIIEEYTPFHHQDYQTIVGKIKTFATGGNACVLSTINGDSNVPFFKEFAASGLTAEDCPVVSLSVSEDEFRSLPTKDLVGHLGCWTYFMSLDTPANNKFTKAWADWLADTDEKGVVKNNRVTCSPMVLSYNGVYLWKAAVEKAGTFDPTAVMKALEEGISFDGPAGTVTTQKNHHLTKNVYIGETRSDGQFEVVKSFDNVVGEPFLKGTFK